ncbi:MAG: type II secretion system protein GspJ [Candidatus Omnitrophica bacterium]|nr:type II secretion system protein GspJ [Candidatus Omnitrophota bacterium]MCM8802631.1 type II secretion system protein GspJ [Candidatus Omnitrophota bacterium]
MKENILSHHLEEDNGFTLIEILISVFVFTFVCFTSIFILKNSLLSSRKKQVEKEIMKEIVFIYDFIEKRISNAMINNLSGKYRMNFKGGDKSLKCVSSFSEDKEGDIAKFGIYWKDNKIMVNMVRVDRENPDFTFFDGFPGAQTLGIDIKDFSIKYFDGERWCESWDTETMEEPKLPELIEIKIVVSKGKIEGKEIEKEIKKTIKIGF